MNQSTTITDSGNVSVPGTLAHQVFISDPIPFDEVEKAPNGDRRMFQPISSTLIFGETDAVLVDPPMTLIKPNGSHSGSNAAESG